MPNKTKDPEQMRREQNRIAQRLTAITNAKPVHFSFETPKRRSSSPERAARKAIFRLARLITREGASIRCIVYNISATGVRVALDGDDAGDLPLNVVLKFDLDGETKKCKVIWQNKTDAGLKFSEIKQPPSGT